MKWCNVTSGSSPARRRRRQWPRSGEGPTGPPSWGAGTTRAHSTLSRKLLHPRPAALSRASSGLSQKLTALPDGSTRPTCSHASQLLAGSSGPLKPPSTWKPAVATPKWNRGTPKAEPSPSDDPVVEDTVHLPGHQPVVVPVVLAHLSRFATGIRSLSAPGHPADHPAGHPSTLCDHPATAPIRSTRRSLQTGDGSLRPGRARVHSSHENDGTRSGAHPRRHRFGTVHRADGIDDAGGSHGTGL